ncbi:von Willebrand factor type A [Reticulomyxa filosa]|uniref:von Willebrand factor type A n=1 Tax=Reticulomyxa filosa TaxID=46433 RepID=X6M0U0_RETFI|nr:von Willebrand factor type A [Reticulomyxa filosa]|eukprot:ETO07231.1 von Willebrand factor type A [Reticulomyxa filosa]
MYQTITKQEKSDLQVTCYKLHTHTYLEGAKTTSNFRENIKEGYMPLEKDITYEGLFYDYSFDLRSEEDKAGTAEEVCKVNELFCPYYVEAIEPEAKSIYLAVGLNSGIQESEFQRRKLNLVVVLDISGSMNSFFNSYYYDANRNSGNTGKSKIEGAKSAVIGLLKHIRLNEDRFGMVLFDSNSRVYRPLEMIKSAQEMQQLQTRIMEDITIGGSTNMESGFMKAIALFEGIRGQLHPSFDNRIIFVTDAMPNTGMINGNTLADMMKRYSQHDEEHTRIRVYTTFIGVGVDMNSDLIEQISKMQGCNYYSIHGYDDFVRKFDNDFLQLNSTSSSSLSQSHVASLDIVDVYGSPNANASSNGNLMFVHTLFPLLKIKPLKKSKVRFFCNKNIYIYVYNVYVLYNKPSFFCGVILLQLRTNKNQNDTDTPFQEISLVSSYKDRDDREYSSQKQVHLRWKSQDRYYANLGIRKAVLLTKYVQTVKQWIKQERSHLANNDVNTWERQSTSLQVSETSKIFLLQMKQLFEQEMQVIGDSKLQQELDILNFLVDYEPKNNSSSFSIF